MAKSSPPRTNRSRRRDGAPREPQTVASDHVIWAPPVGVPVAGAPDPGAVSVFERAMAALQRHEYRKALTEFEALQRHFPLESALLDRARGYAALCQRELSRSSAVAPRTIEERLTAATAALNNGEDQRAEQLIGHVLRDAPRHELAHYLLAVVHARRGAVPAALDALRHAIAASPEVRAQARHDADFESLRGNHAFEQMMCDTSAQSGIRRRS
jgi:predicted Zn-dependent protease